MSEGVGEKERHLSNLVRRALLLGAEFLVTDRDGPGTLPGWDSFGHVQVMLAIQSAYGIDMEPSEVSKIETVSDIRAILRTKGVTNL
jgi:acyl carrier protein